MAYLTLLDRDDTAKNFFAIMRPRRLVSGFTLFSGSVYSASFPYGFITSIKVDGVALTEGTSTSLSAGQFYFDAAAETLYVRTSDSVDPDTKDAITAIFEVYLATFPKIWHRDPLDTSTDEVHWEPVLSKTSVIKADLSEVFYGALPRGSSSVNVSDASQSKNDTKFQRMVNDSSFKGSEVIVYHWISMDSSDDVTVANLKKVQEGLIDRVDYALNEHRFRILDRIDEFSDSYRNKTGTNNFYHSSDFPNLDPQFFGAPIRYVYGVVDGFLPVGVDFVDSSSATTSDNRDWCCIGEQVNLANLDISVVSGSTTTSTRVSNAHGFRIGDRVHLDRASGTDDYVEVISVTYSPAAIGHRDITATGGAMTAGDTVRRSFVGAVDIVQQGVKYELQFGRDYTTLPAMAGGTAGFRLTDNFEATFTMDTFTSSDEIFCRVYGRTNDVVVSGPTAVGSNDTESGNLTNPVAIVLDLLMNRVGLPEARIDTAAFVSLAASVTEGVSVLIPEDNGSTFPTYISILQTLFESGLLKIYLDGDLKWTISQVGVIGSNDFEILDADMTTGSFEYGYSYAEMGSKISVDYDRRERGLEASSTQEEFSRVSADSNAALYLHEVDTDLVKKSLHFKSADAQTHANRMAAILGERIGTLKVDVPVRFFEVKLNDVVRVTSSRLPYDAVFDLETEHSRDFVVIGVEKSLRGVTLKLDDQKGIEENPGLF